MNPFWFCAYFSDGLVETTNQWEPEASTHPPLTQATRTTWLGSMWPLELLMPIVGRVWCARVENPRRRSTFSTRDRGWVFWDGKHGIFFPIQGQGLGKKLVDGGLKYGFRMFYVDGYSFLWRIWVGLLVLKERNYRRFLNSQPWWRKGATTLDRISGHDWKYLYVKRWNTWIRVVIRVYFKVSKNSRSGSNCVQCCWAPDLVFECVLPCPKWQMFGCKM